MNHSQQRTLQ
ncbi:type III secretion system apparatus protein, partial [Yersinia pestis PY-65]